MQPNNPQPQNNQNPNIDQLPYLGPKPNIYPNQIVDGVTPNPNLNPNPMGQPGDPRQQMQPGINQPPSGMKSKKTRNKMIAITVILLIVIVLGAITYFMFKPSNSEVADNQPAQSSTTETADQSTESEDSTQTQEIDSALAENKKRTDRKNAVIKVAAAINEYLANSNGILLTEEAYVAGDLVTKGYIKLDDEFIDPETEVAYVFVNSEPKLGQISFKAKAKCGDDNKPVASESTRQFAVYTELSDDIYYCSE